MKKTIAMLVLMLMLISMTACGQTPAENGESQTPGIQNGDQGQSGDDVVPTEPETTLPPEPVKQWYEDESVIMYLTADRLDHKKDGSTKYYYNYKGDQVSYFGSGEYPPVYAENGLALAYSPAAEKYGYADREGNFVIDPIYAAATHFTPDGLVTVKMKDETEETGFYGVIDSEGEEVLPFVYERLSSFYPSGYAAFGVKTDKVDEFFGYNIYLYGVIDKTGKVIVEPTYPGIRWIGDGYLMAEQETENMFEEVYNIYDFDGNVVYACIQEDERCNEAFVVRDNRLWRIQEKFEPEENQIKADITWEYFDDGKFVKDPAKPCYQIETKNVTTTKSGVAYGVNANGENVIPFQYDCVFEESGYLYCTKQNGEGNYSLDVYDEQFQKVAEGLPYYRSNNLMNLVSVDPEPAFVEVEHNYYTPKGFFTVSKKVDGKTAYGIVDANGNEIVEVIYKIKPIAWCYENVAQLQNG